MFYSLSIIIIANFSDDKLNSPHGLRKFTVYFYQRKLKLCDYLPIMYHTDTRLTRWNEILYHVVQLPITSDLDVSGAIIVTIARYKRVDKYLTHKVHAERRSQHIRFSVPSLLRCFVASLLRSFCCFVRSFNFLVSQLTVKIFTLYPNYSLGENNISSKMRTRR